MSSLQVGVVGLGLLGRGIVTCLLSRGFEVVACEVHPEQRLSAEVHIEHALKQMAERSVIEQSVAEGWRTRFRNAENLEELAGCGFVIESVIENYEVKQQLIAALEQLVAADVPIASNTSAIPITLFQQQTQHPERIIGMHWAEPCHLTRFLEVIRGEQTDDATVEKTLLLGRRAGKDPCLVQKDVRGFIINRLAYAMYREAFWLLENKVADVDTIDRAFHNAMCVWGNIAGPFRWMDLTGLPAYASVMEKLFAELSCQQELPAFMKELVDSGAKGIANGRGFYEYTPDEARQWEQRLTENVWQVQKMKAELLPEPELESKPES